MPLPDCSTFINSSATAEQFIGILQDNSRPKSDEVIAFIPEVSTVLMSVIRLLAISITDITPSEISSRDIVEIIEDRRHWSQEGSAPRSNNRTVVWSKIDQPKLFIHSSFGYVGESFLNHETTILYLLGSQAERKYLSSLGKK